MSEAATKVCTKCKAALSLQCFGIERASKDGLKRWCKPCSASHLAEWSAANPTKVQARKARYRAKNRERLREVSRQWRKANPDASSAAIERWHAAHPEVRRVARTEWAQKNRAYGAEHSAMHRAQNRMATPPWASSELQSLVFAEAYDAARRRSALTGVRHHVDHIVPLSSRIVCGLHCAANLRVIPAAINQSKSNRHWPDMP